MQTRQITRAISTLLLTGACSLIALPAVAQQAPADNTKVNKADRAKGAVTADQQKENPRTASWPRRFGSQWLATSRYRPTHTT